MKEKQYAGFTQACWPAVMRSHPDMWKAEHMAKAIELFCADCVTKETILIAQKAAKINIKDIKQLMRVIHPFWNYSQREQVKKIIETNY